MATPTYTALAEGSFGVGATILTFSSIPATYRDLVLIYTGDASTAGLVAIRFNGDSGSNYSTVRMRGTGSTTNSDSQSGETSGRISFSNNAYGNKVIQVMDYSADKHKTYLVRENVSSSAVVAIAGRWASTAAVTSVEIYAEEGVSVALYGIAS